MFQILRYIITLGLYIPTMWLFMHLIRPYTDMGTEWLARVSGSPWTATAIIIGTPWTLYLILKYFERPADAPPSRLDWLLRRRY